MVSDFVVARNCCLARMLPGEGELVSEWTRLPGRAKSVQRFERSDGLDIALYKNYFCLFTDWCLLTTDCRHQQIKSQYVIIAIFVVLVQTYLYPPILYACDEFRNYVINRYDGVIYSRYCRCDMRWESSIFVLGDLTEWRTCHREIIVCYGAELCVNVLSQQLIKQLHTACSM